VEREVMKILVVMKSGEKSGVEVFW